MKFLIIISFIFISACSNMTEKKYEIKFSDAKHNLKALVENREFLRASCYNTIVDITFTAKNKYFRVEFRKVRKQGIIEDTKIEIWCVGKKETEVKIITYDCFMFGFDEVNRKREQYYLDIINGTPYNKSTHKEFYR